MNKYVILISIVLCLFAVLVAGCGNRRGAGQKKKSVKEPGYSDTVNSPQSRNSQIDVASGQELMSSAESEQEARDIAAKYGIEFVDYSWGVATYHTTEDPSAVIERGKKNGLPELSLNSMATAFSDQAGTGGLGGGNAPQ